MIGSSRNLWSCAVDHQHHRPLIDRIAGLGADAGLPVLRQERHQVGDLLLEIVRGIAGQRDLVPDQARRRVQRLHVQPRRVGIVQVGEHQHGRRMLVEPVRHLLQREPDVLEADLLADDIERHVREAVVHRAHHPQHHRAVADAGIEHAHRRRPRMDVAELQRHAVRDHPFLAAGVDEQQILLPVVEEAEIALRVVARRGAAAGRGPTARAGGGRSMIEGRALSRRRGCVHEGADAVERVGRDPPAVAQPRRELAVVDGAAAEGRFGEPGLAAIVGDFLQQLLVVHPGHGRLFS